MVEKSLVGNGCACCCCCRGGGGGDCDCSSFCSFGLFLQQLLVFTIEQVKLS